jgi:hypothetical protein
VKLPALASVTEGASPDMTRWLQTLAICRWTKQRKPSKAKGGPPPAASKGQLFAVCKLHTLVLFSTADLSFAFVARIFLSALYALFFLIYCSFK